MPAPLRLVRRPVAFLAAGLLLWTSFPPLNWWPAGPAGVAAFTLAAVGASTRAGILGGWLTGLGLFVPMLSFLRGLGVDAWLIVAVGEALWFAVLALATTWTVRSRWWPLGIPALWVAVEFSRDRVPFGGFPWGRLAFGQAHGPLLPLAALGGAPLVTFAAALIGAVTLWLAIRAVDRRARPTDGGPLRGRAWFRLAAPALGAYAVVIGGAFAVPLPTAGTSAGGPAEEVVAVVQGNVPRLGLGEFDQALAVTENHLAETRALAAEVAAGRVPRPVAVLWPENSTDVDPYRNPDVHAMIMAAARAIGVPVIVGAVADGPDASHAENLAIVWSPRGPGETYVKRHLVPFGEYVPFRRVLTHLVGRFSMVQRDFATGDRPGVLQAGPVRLGDVICYEVAFDGIVRDTVEGGARLLTVQTNNATYERPGDSGRGGETAQQLEMSRLRAVEHGRAVLVAATSGVSAVIAPDGTVEQRSEVFRPATLVAQVPLRDPKTLADRVGPWPERVLAAAGLVALAAGVRRRFRPAPAAAPTADAEVPVLAGDGR